ncbi:glutathione ABC transporter permease GsiC [Falsirhodobacter sp. 20TX0035]|uniref:glutathione ABC transporter permease GsiC n=1 Tax=Falsirhodobacter sp. 20TX0035 TaxID=3022019 RepID=UPI00232ED34B|nr:glutathione ABC transporter permease GsiC [Falsirhodobacter sp. 20TX0035]MDB6452521.1 glutathione ABC transporter permease GsiC [Falsirhodobacter sp. 20TX0035]
MLSYLIKRLLGAIPVVLMVTLAVFAFVHLLPGDPARLVAGPEATAQDVEAVRTALGLDKPLPQQFATYLSNTVQGDFGTSLKTRRPVAEEIGMRLMPTIWLTVFAMVWAVAVGLLIGVISAVRRGRWPDYTGMIVAVSGISFPPFWLGLLLINLFSVRLGWLPTGGYGTWQHFIMPSFTLGLGVAAVMARFTRSAFIEIAREDYVRTARAKGVPERRVIWRHSLRNALIPIITMVGLQFGFLLGGSIVVESVFSWPGVGRLLVDSVSYRDYPVIQALVLMFSLQFILINLLVDVLYVFANPEIRYK